MTDSTTILKGCRGDFSNLDLLLILFAPKAKVTRIGILVLMPLFVTKLWLPWLGCLVGGVADSKYTEWPGYGNQGQSSNTNLLFIYLFLKFLAFNHGWFLQLTELHPRIATLKKSKNHLKYL